MMDNCKPKRCGNLPNISYPFWLTQQHPSYCGYPAFAVSCEDNIPVLHMSQNFHILGIFYENQSVVLVDAGIYKNSCPLPRYNLNFGLSMFEISSVNRVLSIFFNCSHVPVDSFKVLPCELLTNSSVHLSEDHWLDKQWNPPPKPCRIVIRPVLGYQGANSSDYATLLGRGFLLKWEVADCTECKQSNGQCGYDNKTAGFMCICNDGTHLQSCDSQSALSTGQSVRILESFSVAKKLRAIAESGPIEFTEDNVRKVSFFDCSKLEDTFDHEFFLELNRTTPCKSYNFYYTSRMLDNPTLEALPPYCSTHWEPSYEWNFSFNEDGVLSLLSVGFSNHLELKHECFDCGIIGSGCSVNGGHRTVCQEKFQKKMTKLIVTGVSVGFATFLAACCLFLSYKCYKRNQRSSTILLGRTYSSESSFSKREDAECQTPIFSYRELKEATDNFSESKELGDGGFGTVYKGELRDGRIVAVKRLYENNYKRVEQFMNEVAILSRLRHQNLVTLYGCTSRHSRELLLVYEYIPNGTVADHLHGRRAHEASLSWQVRLSIAVETATALAYLHAVEPPIIHRDVKTNNILLDNNFNVKVADFGLSRLFPLDATHISTAPQGTPGYLDPEYHQCYRLTQKSDVYSFGVVLVELISSKPAVDVTRRHHEINLASMAINKIQNNELDELVDAKLFSESEEVRRMIKVVAELAFRCLQGERDLRPPIKEVLEVLRGVQSSEEGCSVSSAPPVSPDSVMDHVCVSESTTSRASL
ncbi:hypothetical protein J5N97_027804 [Dioscorea zingiberensis]|uniref:non-specific serine/threonine protein kinase n=1 Tax=Dioscorea zingiberensis TaxID=325984 RepID=A0A9D5BXT5_9LILI|nr:hypothetical protein J5N97_027804 [Dioscorea zingiberensis]